MKRTITTIGALLLTALLIGLPEKARSASTEAEFKFEQSMCMTPGEKRNLNVQIKNTSGREWIAFYKTDMAGQTGSPDHWEETTLWSWWNEKEAWNTFVFGYGKRIPKNVRPGEWVTITMPVAAPQQVGPGAMFFALRYCHGSRTQQCFWYNDKQLAKWAFTVAPNCAERKTNLNIHKAKPQLKPINTKVPPK